MATAASIIHQQAQGVSAETGTTKSSTSSSSTDSGTITANDFLTLLVTELQNQDPTTASDPTAYINQLVSVNSLQQLISINQTLTDALDTSSSSAPGGQTVQAQSASSSNVHTASNVAQQVSGNLSVPQASASATTVAQALSGKHAAN